MQAKPMTSGKAPTSIWLFILLGGTLLLTAWMAMQDNSGNAEDLVADSIKVSASASPENASSERKNSTNLQNTTQNNSQNTTQNTTQKTSVFKQNTARLNAQNIALLSPNQRAALWAAIERPSVKTTPVDLFNVQSWEVIKKVKPGPPPKPTAPPVPYTYVGKLEDTPKGTQLFLMDNNRLITAIKGEKIEGQWRLDAEDANSIRFTYLPLNLPQTLLKNATQASVNAPNQFNLNETGSVQTGPVENNQ